MRLHDLRPSPGATKRRKRVGRGTGSGLGKTSGRGTKGQNSRTGGGVRPTFEGGQLPLVKRLPKLRGFNNRFKVSYVPVNLDDIDARFEADSAVTPESLHDMGLLRNIREPVVILARGEVTKAMAIQGHRVSTRAREKIEAAGGTVELLPFVVTKVLPRS